MPQIRLDDLNDPRAVDYRAIGDAELLQRRGCFVAEGRLVVQRVLGNGSLAVRSLLLSEAAASALAPALADLRSDVPIYICGPEDFIVLTGFNIHRGCLALVDVPTPIDLSALLSTAQTVVVLEAVANADNVGGVFRNAAAFGADAVLLSPTCCSPLYRKAVRTSMAAVLKVPFGRLDPWPDSLAMLRACGFTIVGLTPRQPSESIDAFASRPRPDRLALLVGAEGPGITEAALSLVDIRVRIPISDEVDSLNLSVAVGIALSRLRAAMAP
jgi:tRNA G18 (ribose-2'-O)-methylase SpoU